MAMTRSVSTGTAKRTNDRLASTTCSPSAERAIEIDLAIALAARSRSRPGDKASISCSREAV